MCMPRCKLLKNGHLLERKDGALYQRVSELLLSHKDEWRKMKWKLYAEVQRPEERVSSWEEGSSSSLGDEWAVAEYQRGMTQDKMKLVCRCATSWKMGIYLRARVESFTVGRESWCWVPKKDNAENEKNDYKTEKGNRKRKYKHFFDATSCMRKIFDSLLKTYKDSYKLLIMSRVSCSDEFL